MAAATPSPSVRIQRVSAAVGLGMAATVLVPKDAILWEESPIAAVSSIDGNTPEDSSCSRCLRSLLPASATPLLPSLLPLVAEHWPHCAPTRCPKCAALFCSEACMTAAVDEYHRWECGRGFPGDDALREGWDPTTIDCLRLTHRLLLIWTSRSPTVGLEQLAHLRRFQSTRSAALTPEQLARLDVWLCRWRNSAGLLPPPPDYSDLFALTPFLEVFGIVRNTSITVTPLPAPLVFLRRITNPTAPGRAAVLRVLADEPDVVPSLTATAAGAQPRGVALYTWLPFLNHSCDPSVAARATETTVLRVLSRQAIGPGEALCLAYVPVEEYPDRWARRAFLQLNWGFVCQCPSCGEGDHADTERAAAVEREKAAVKRLRADVSSLHHELAKMRREMSELDALAEGGVSSPPDVCD